MNFRSVAPGVILLSNTSGSHTGNKQESVNSGCENVGVVTSDDHAPHTMGAYSNDQIRKPNINRLAQNGIQFSNAYLKTTRCGCRIRWYAPADHS